MKIPSGSQDRYRRRQPVPPKRRIPVKIDGVTLENPLDDAERVLGEGRGINPGRRAKLWGGIGAVSGAIPGVGVLTSLAGLGMAARGMDQRDNPDGMPLVTPMLALGSVAGMVAGAAGVAVVANGGSLTNLLPGMVINSAMGGLNWAIAGYHGRNFS